MLLGVVPMQNKVRVAEARECPWFGEPFADLGTPGSFPAWCFYSSAVLLLRENTGELVQLHKSIKSLAGTSHIPPS